MTNWLWYSRVIIVTQPKYKKWQIKHLAFDKIAKLNYSIKCVCTLNRPYILYVPYTYTNVIHIEYKTFKPNTAESRHAKYTYTYEQCKCNLNFIHISLIILMFRYRYRLNGARAARQIDINENCDAIQFHRKIPLIVFCVTFFGKYGYFVNDKIWRNFSNDIFPHIKL